MTTPRNLDAEKGARAATRMALRCLRDFLETAEGAFERNDPRLIEEAANSMAGHLLHLASASSRWLTVEHILDGTYKRPERREG